MTTLLFDYGGTLDSDARHWNYLLLDAYRHAAAHGHPVLRAVEGDIWREAYVHGERELARHPHIAPTDNFHTLLRKKALIELNHLRAAAHIDLTDEQTRRAADHIADHCDQAARATAQRSRHVLEELRRRGYPFVLVTNFYGNIRAVLRAYGLDELFPLVVESAVVGVRKPDPAIWQLGIEAAAVPAADCIAIGDSYGKDILPAHALGCRTIWFKGEEWTPKAYDESLPTHVIDRLDTLLRLLP